MHTKMAVSIKSIRAALFLVFGATFLLLGWEYHHAYQSHVGISFGFTQLKKYRLNSWGKQQNDAETHRQNLSSVYLSHGGGMAFASNISCTKNCNKQILYWPGPKMLFPDGEYFCEDINCKVTFKSGKSYSALHNSDAVLLHHLGNWNVEELMRHRPKDQIWIYMSWESPPHSHHGRLPNVFNWTLTYHSESDFPSPYSSYKEYDSVTKEQNLIKNKKINWAKKKTKLAAWVASNCKGPSWPRTQFVKDLSRKMTIDMFGGCGNKSCPGRNCIENLKYYKFYFALENSCCTDYITEKMWWNSLLHDVVPIVYGTYKRRYEKLAPPNSFIHVSDFPNMTSLANYIKLLDRNDSLYNNFFRWKDFGYIDKGGEAKVVNKERLCLMAKKLCSDPKPIINDIGKAWFDTCHDNPPLPLPV